MRHRVHCTNRTVISESIKALTACIRDFSELGKLIVITYLGLAISCCQVTAKKMVNAHVLVTKGKKKGAQNVIEPFVELDGRASN